MSLIFATQLAALATAVLAVGAIVTGVLAYLAFHAQTKEVGILQQQMHEHQQALEHEAIERHREQASRVWILILPDSEVARRALPAIRPFPDPAAAEGQVLEAMVRNTSERQQPIYNAKLHWYKGSERYGTPNPELIGALPGYENTARRRIFPHGADLATCGAFLTFHDAAGYAWMRAPDGALTEHPPDEADEAAQTAIRALTAGSRQSQQGA